MTTKQVAQPSLQKLNNCCNVTKSKYKTTEIFSEKDK